MRPNSMQARKIPRGRQKPAKSFQVHPIDREEVEGFRSAKAQTRLPISCIFSCTRLFSLHSGRRILAKRQCALQTARSPRKRTSQPVHAADCFLQVAVEQAARNRNAVTAVFSIAPLSAKRNTAPEQGVKAAIFRRSPHGSRGTEKDDRSVVPAGKISMIYSG